MPVLTLNKWNISIGDGQPLVVIAGLNVLEGRPFQVPRIDRTIDSRV